LHHFFIVARDFHFCKCKISFLYQRKPAKKAFPPFTLAFAFAIAHKLYLNYVFKLSPYVVTAFAVFLLSFFVKTCRRAVFDVGCRSPPVNLDFQKNSD